MKKDKYKLSEILQQSCPEPKGEIDFEERLMQRIEHQKRLAPERKKRVLSDMLKDLLLSPLVLIFTVFVLILINWKEILEILQEKMPELNLDAWYIYPFCGVLLMVVLAFYFSELQED